MKVGYIVDGKSEFSSLGVLFAQIAEGTENTLLAPLWADIQPLSDFAVIGRACESRLSILGAKGVDRAVILFDREGREECPRVICRGVQEILQPHYDFEIAVVLKDRTFENWLLADVDALAKSRKRFQINDAMRDAIAPNKADQIDGLKTIKKCIVNKGQYEKVRDSGVILAGARIDRMAANSRSFRRFLRCSGYPGYVAQSKKPAS